MPAISSSSSSSSSSSIHAPEVRLILLPKDPHGAETATIADEIVIYCQQGPAYKYENRIYYVLALENIVTKERIPLLPSERITMKIFDERDPYDGVMMLNRPGLTSAPWKNFGFVYFKAIQFCQVGQYRITFHLETKRFGNGKGVKDVQYIVVATDPEWEAEQLNAILEDLNKLDKKQSTKETTGTNSSSSSSSTSYAFRSFTKTEKDWLLTHSTHLPPDPPNHLLVQLAHDMHTALHTPAVKDISIIAPLFESETKRNARQQAEKEKKLMLAKHGMMIARLVMNEEKKQDNTSSTTPPPSSATETTVTDTKPIGKGGYANLSLQAKKELLQRMQNELLGTTATVLQDNNNNNNDNDDSNSNSNNGKDMDTTNDSTAPSTTITTEESKIITDTLVSSSLTNSSSSSSHRSPTNRRKVPRKISDRGDDEGPYQPWHLADREHWNEAYERARKWLVRYTEERHHWIDINRLYRAAVATGANEQERKKIVSRKLKGQSSDKIITRHSDCYRVHRFEGSIAAGETIVFMDRIALPEELVARWKLSANEWLRQAEEYRKNKLEELENDWTKRVAKAKKDYERRFLSKRTASENTVGSNGTILSLRASPTADENAANLMMDIVVPPSESPVTITPIAHELNASNDQTDVTMSTKDSPVSTAGIVSLSSTSMNTGGGGGGGNLSFATRLSSSSSSSLLSLHNDIPDFDEATMVKGKRPDLNDHVLHQALLVEGFAKVSGNTVPYIQSLKIFLESRHPILNKQNGNSNTNNNSEGNTKKRSRTTRDETKEDQDFVSLLSSSSSSSSSSTGSTLSSSFILPSIEVLLRSKRKSTNSQLSKNKAVVRRIPPFIRRTDPSLGYPASDGSAESVYTQVTLPPPVRTAMETNPLSVPEEIDTSLVQDTSSSSSSAVLSPSSSSLSKDDTDHTPLPVPKGVPTSETLAGFIIRCSELLDQYRDLAYALKLIVNDRSNVLQPLAKQLLASTSTGVSQTQELIELTLDAVRKKIDSPAPVSSSFSSSPTSSSSLSPRKSLSSSSPSSSSTSPKVSVAMLSTSTLTEGVSSSIPIHELIPKVSNSWLKHLQEEYMSLIVKATIVGADPQLKAPVEDEANDDTTTSSSKGPHNESSSPDIASHPKKSSSPSSSTAASTTPVKNSSSSTDSHTGFNDDYPVYTRSLTDKFYKDIEILCSLSYTGHPQGGMRLPPPGHTRYSWTYPVPWQVKLYRAIVLARETERTFTFRNELETEINAFLVPKYSQYYTYSSSLYYYNFLQILDDKLYQAYIRTIQYNQSSFQPQQRPLPSPSVPYNPNHRDILVLGSSIGLLQFYISCSNNVRTIGVDILPIMIQTAYGIAVSSGILDSGMLNPSTTPSASTAPSSSSSTSPIVQFLQGDLSTINPSIFRFAGMVLCNSPSWDTRLRRTIYSRLLMQCPADTLIIDYVHPQGILWRNTTTDNNNRNNNNNSSSPRKYNTDNNDKEGFMHNSRSNNYNNYPVVSKERLAILPISPSRNTKGSSSSNVNYPVTTGKLYEVRELEYLTSKPYDITSDIYQYLYFSKITVQIWTEEQVQKYSISTTPPPTTTTPDYGAGSFSSPNKSENISPSISIIPTSIPKVPLTTATTDKDGSTTVVTNTQDNDENEAKITTGIEEVSITNSQGQQEEEENKDHYDATADDITSEEQADKEEN